MARQMAYEPRRKSRRSALSPPRDQPAHASASAEPIDNAIRSLIEGLGPVMVDEGLTAKAVADIAKRVLVNEAARRSTMATGRVNHSKVAALTGLTRSEVRSLLKGQPLDLARKRTGLDRITRVIEGWHADPRFLSANGTPRTLNLGAKTGEFGDLVRRHSGDIPPRVVLEQLLEKNRVKIQRGQVRLLATKASTSETKAARQRPDVSPYVSDVLAAAASDRVKLTFAHRLELHASSESETHHLSDRVARTLSTAVAALRANAIDGADAQSGAKIVVSIAVTTHDPSHTKIATKKTEERRAKKSTEPTGNPS